MGVKEKSSISEKPVLFSDYFNIEKEKLEKLGVFNPILNLDTKLFVEPLLLKSSKNNIIKQSYQTFIKYFEDLMILIKLSKSFSNNDIHWREAIRRVKFPEYKSTCIGYGSNSTSGSGSGRDLNEKILKNAKDIIESGSEYPQMFTILPFLEEGIGGDIISDMTQTIINDDICRYTKEIMDDIGLKGDFEYKTEQGIKYNFLYNPFSKCEIKFLPLDILTNLPMADNFDNWIVEIAQLNHHIRKQVNQIIGEAWLEKNKSDKKDDIKNILRTDKKFFLEIVKIITTENFDHYDLKEDKQGIYRWLEDAKRITKENHIKITNPLPNDQESLKNAVLSIISDFKYLIENDEIWRIFATKRNGKKYFVNELYSQMFFYSSCQMWLDGQNSNITLLKEFSSVDDQIYLTFYCGKKNKILVQIKHASNNSLAKIYDRQIEISKTNKIPAFYVVVNFKEDNSNQYDLIKQKEDSNCKIIKIDAIEPSKQMEFQLESKNNLPDFFIDFENMPSDQSLYFKEKQKGGQNSYQNYKPLKQKVEELCKKELKNGRCRSASDLCENVSYLIEEDYPELLDDFNPYKIHSEDGGGWTKGTFYNWCNDNYKKFK